MSWALRLLDVDSSKVDSCISCGNWEDTFLPRNAMHCLSLPSKRMLWGSGVVLQQLHQMVGYCGLAPGSQLAHCILILLVEKGGDMLQQHDLLLVRPVARVLHAALPLAGACQ